MKERIQRSLSKIIVFVSNSTKAPMLPAQLDELKAAIVFLHDHWPAGDAQRDRARGIRDAVCASGIISMPPRKALHPQSILKDCEALLQYIEKQGPALWNISN